MGFQLVTCPNGKLRFMVSPAPYDFADDHQLTFKIYFKNAENEVWTCLLLGKGDPDHLGEFKIFPKGQPKHGSIVRTFGLKKANGHTYDLKILD